MLPHRQLNLVDQTSRSGIITAPLLLNGLDSVGIEVPTASEICRTDDDPGGLRREDAPLGHQGLFFHHCSRSLTFMAAMPDGVSAVSSTACG